MRSASVALQWSSEDILVLTKQPPECRCRGRVLPSLVGDIRDFSTPSNWTVIEEKARDEASSTRLKSDHQNCPVQRAKAFTGIYTVVAVEHVSNKDKKPGNNQGCALINMHKHTESLSACHSTEGHVHKSI